MNFKQLITSPTRITESSRTLIDVIMTSTPDIVHESGVINSTISDHFPVYMVLNSKLPEQPPSYITVRSYKNYNSTLFTADLVSKYDTLVEYENEVNLKLSKFNDALLYPPYKFTHQSRQSRSVTVRFPISPKTSKI